MIIEGGCQKCGLTTQVHVDIEDFNEDVGVICPSCYQKYFSKEAIRNKRIEHILKEPWWKKLFNRDRF